MSLLREFLAFSHYLHSRFIIIIIQWREVNRVQLSLWILILFTNVTTSLTTTDTSSSVCVLLTFRFAFFFVYYKVRYVLFSMILLIHIHFFICSRFFSCCLSFVGGKLVISNGSDSVVWVSLLLITLILLFPVCVCVCVCVCVSYYPIGCSRAQFYFGHIQRNWRRKFKKKLRMRVTLTQSWLGSSSQILR